MVGGSASLILPQVVSIVAVVAWSLVTGFALFYLLKFTMGRPRQRGRGTGRFGHLRARHPDLPRVGGHQLAPTADPESFPLLTGGGRGSGHPRPPLSLLLPHRLAVIPAPTGMTANHVLPWPPCGVIPAPSGIQRDEWQTERTALGHSRLCGNPGARAWFPFLNSAGIRHPLTTL